MSETTDNAQNAHDTSHLVDGAQIIPQTDRAVEPDAATAAQTPTANEEVRGPDASEADAVPPAEETGSAADAGEKQSETASPAAEAEESEAAPERKDEADRPSPAAAKPRPIPRPRPSTWNAPVAPKPIDSDAVRRAAAWGRVDDEGNVYLRSADGERIVGQYAAGGSRDDAIALFARRYVELAAEVSFLESRVENVSPSEAEKSLQSLDGKLREPNVIGDVESLRSQVAAIKTRVAERREEIQERRRAAKEEALAVRTGLVEKAEAIAARDPKRIHWNDSRKEFDQIFQDWQTAQRTGARIDRPTEEALWKRFSRARSAFDRMRRTHFSELEAQRAVVTAEKNRLIKEAEAIQDSTDWGQTAAAFRSLMDQWRKAGRTSRREDDKLWSRFHAAQQKFFDARSRHFSARDQEQAENLKLKLELVAEAERLVPVEDIETAKETLRGIQDRWEEIGMVPRAELSRTEGRLRKVEDAIREAEREHWIATDPQVKRRSDGMATQLQRLIAELDTQIAEAESAGDHEKVAELKKDREARQTWLDQVSQDL